jgi:glycine oxidase
MAMSEKVIILGGGIVGLSCAWACRRDGHEVTLLEPYECGGQASGAAAGMLAPFAENAEGADPFFQLSLASLRLYPKWRDEVSSASAIPFEYTNSGTLLAVYHEADVLALEERLRWQRPHGSQGSIIAGDELFRMEPLLARNTVAAMHIPVESHVYAPDYVRALRDACSREGVQIVERLQSVEVVDWRNGLEIRTGTRGIFTGDRLVVCMGAWSQELERTFGIRIPIYPIRGQICAYTAPDRPVRHMVFGSQGYLVAKANGTLVCGASEDVAGFDTSVTERGISRLRKWNKAMFPHLADQEPFHTWAGLRPATQDGFPLIGALPEAKHVIFATGHYRNGILLSPVTGEWVAAMIRGMDKETEGASLLSRIHAPSFAPERFGRV